MLKCVRGLLKIYYGKTIQDMDGYDTNGSDTMCKTQEKHYYQVDEWGFVHKVEEDFYRLNTLD